jgi:DNA-binding transcriptional regulator YhcF (GntR family)
MPRTQSEAQEQWRAAPRAVQAQHVQSSPWRPAHQPPARASTGGRARCSRCGAEFVSLDDTTAATFLERHRAQHAPIPPVDPADGYWRDGTVKLWYQLYIGLKQDLATGRFKPGTALPILSLCTEYKVAQPTLTRVLGQLADEQLVRYVGTGTRRLTVVCGEPEPSHPAAEAIRERIQTGIYTPVAQLCPRPSSAGSCGSGPAR